MKIEKYLSTKNDLSSLADKNIFITGGNSGIGFELAHIVASYKANVFLLCRNIKKAEIAKEQILKDFPDAKVEIISLDLADLNSIKTAVDEIKKYDVDAFVNNAGVYRLPKSSTKDGFEIIMGTNFIGTLYLNDLLNEHFRSIKHGVRIVFTSSITSKVCSLKIDDLFMERKYNKMIVYGRSKVGINAIYFKYLEENANEFITYSLVHPGVTYTPLIDKGYKSRVFAKIASIFMKIAFHSPKKAALSLLEGIIGREKVQTYGPRGFLGFSGIPHKWSVKKPKNGDRVVDYARKLTAEKIGHIYARKIIKN